MKRNVLNSPGLLELKKRRHRIFLNKFLTLLSGVLVIFLLVAYLSRLDNLNINKIEITGNKILDTETLDIAISKQIAGKYFWLFPKTNILIYPKNNIKNELQNEFKRIKEIDLIIKNNKTLRVSLTEREAKYTWCGEIFSGVGIPQGSSTPEKIEEQCYFMDEDGYVFDEAPYFSGNVYFKFYGPTNNNIFGSNFTEQKFKRLIAFIDILIDLGLKPIALSILNTEDAEIFLLSETSSINEPKIIFKINADFQNIAENLQTALDTEPLKSKFKNKYSTLEYIDLRFENKVYDKFQ